MIKVTFWSDKKCIFEEGKIPRAFIMSFRRSEKIGSTEVTLEFLGEKENVFIKEDISYLRNELGIF